MDFKEEQYWKVHRDIRIMGASGGKDRDLRLEQE